MPLKFQADHKGDNKTRKREDFHPSMNVQKTRSLLKIEEDFKFCSSSDENFNFVSI
jgi:hypothetical protein